IWALDNNGNLMVSRNGGSIFFTLTSPAPYASFYGYYGNVLTVSPADSNLILCGGVKMAVSKDGGASWQTLDTPLTTHPDNHAFEFNPLNAATFYSGNDGGIFVTHDGGGNWTNLNDSLMMSQIYRTSSSQQNPYVILCGLQDNSTYRFDGSNWTDNIGGDGEACAISPADDNIQIGSYQYGNFFLSYDQGNTFNSLYIGPGSMGAWTAPVVFSPGSADTIYFGLKDVYATYDGGYTFTSLGSGVPLFPDGIMSLAVAPSNPQVIYAADYSHIMRTDDGGVTWNDVSGHLTPDSLAITRIAVDYNNPLRVYVTTSGYNAGKKVYASTTGGTAWTNISYNLPNVPANCIAVDSSVIGAIYVGTDMGLYYMDSSMTSWTSYGKGLPNVIVDDLDVNYNVRKIRAATYGRGLWEADLQARNARGPIAVPKVTLEKTVKVYPNPTEDNWQLIFKNGMPKNYHVVVHDLAGRTVYEAENVSVINAKDLKAGNYIIDVNVDGNDYNIKASHK
ncbi:MAG: T9SS type A sorting domain-containing protein, partial [Flavipsychrobacter sp.]